MVYACLLIFYVGERLTIDDIKEVSELLWPIRAKFRRLAVVLSIDPGTQDVLANYPDKGDGLTEVIKVWLKKVNPVPTWKALVKALRYDSIGERELANKIAKEHCPSEVEKVEAGNCKNCMICTYKGWGSFLTPPPIL